MSERQMDESLIRDMIRGMEYEFSRKGPPQDFPEFPDIPNGRYTSEAFYALEQEFLWRSQWIVAGRVEDLPGPGSYFLFDEIGAPLIVIRGNDDQIRCFSNTCRHRGAPVVRESSGTTPYLRCQYHAWTYDIDSGDLKGVPDERDFIGLCKAERGLPKVRCDTWGGFIFINLDGQARPLREYLGPIPERMAQFQCENLRLTGTDHRTVHCNWKVALEAFQEVYHFRFLHDRGGFTLLDSRGAHMMLFDNGHSSMIVPPSRAVCEQMGMDTWQDYRPLPNPFGLEPIPTVHPLLYSSNLSFTIFPNIIIPLLPFGFPFMVFFPRDVGTTDIRIYHYGPEWDGGDLPAGWQSHIEDFGQIIDEDVENLNPIHLAMLSPTYTGTPLSYQERRIWHWNEVIDQVIGMNRVPAELHVPTLMEQYVNG